MSEAQRFRAGEWVEVRSAEEIRATLDADGALGGLPFMPEMAALCGRRFRVHRRADRTCVEGYGLRALDSAVLLDEVRCDGGLHDGCQRDCLFFWKDAWLRAAESGISLANSPPSDLSWTAPTRRGRMYHCQSTALAAATSPLSKWDLRPLVNDVRGRELSWGGLLGFVLKTVVNRTRGLFGLPEMGALSGPASGAKGGLALQPGDWVRIKSADEVRATLDPSGRNHGLTFEPEMALHVGERHRVDFRVEKIILEEDGRMVRLRDTVALKEVVCRGACTKNCPRTNTLFWRESWLERVEAPKTAEPSPDALKHAAE